MLEDASKKVNQAFDIQHLFESQEFLKTAMKVLLSQQQTKIIKRLSMANLT